jgi:hypothetical protein
MVIFTKCYFMSPTKPHYFKIIDSFFIPIIQFLRTQIGSTILSHINICVYLVLFSKELNFNNYYILLAFLIKLHSILKQRYYLTGRPQQKKGEKVKFSLLTRWQTKLKNQHRRCGALRP